METKMRSFCFVYDCTRTAHAVPCQGIYIQRGVFVSVYSYTVFGDTYYLISMTSLYAFLVSLAKYFINADFGGLASKVKVSNHEQRKFTQSILLHGKS